MRFHCVIEIEAKAFIVCSAVPSSFIIVFSVANDLYAKFNLVCILFFSPKPIPFHELKIINYRKVCFYCPIKMMNDLAVAQLANVIFA